MKGVFREVSPPSGSCAPRSTTSSHPEFELVETLTLTQHDGKTTLEVLVLHQTREARDGHVGSGLKWEQGSRSDRLEGLLRSIA